MSLSASWARLRERKLVQWVLGYLAGAWVLLQVVGLLGDAFAWPDVVLRVLSVLLAFGAGVAAVLAWYHGEKGHQRVRTSEVLLLGVLVTTATVACWWTYSAVDVSMEEGPAAVNGGPADPQIDPNSVAVLPFENLSGDPDNRYFSDGLTEELLSVLSRSGELRVVGRTSSFAFRDQDIPVGAIGDSLRVAKVVDGSVRRSDRAIRVAAQLIDADNGFQLWSQTYDSQLRDVFAIQDSIARAIGEQLQVRIIGDESAVARHATDNLRAHDHYLLGLYQWNHRTEESLFRAVERFESAIAEDSAYAPAYAGLANAYITLPHYSAIPPDTAFQRAKRAAAAALEADSLLAEAHTALGAIASGYDWDFETADRHHRRALELNPNYATGHQWRAENLTRAASFDEALREIRTAEELDPLSLIINTVHAQVLYSARRYDEAIRQFDKALRMAPEFPVAHQFLALSYAEAGRFEEALASVRRAVRHGGSTSEREATLAYIHARAGEETEAREVLARLRERAKSQYVQPSDFAVIYANLGETDHAFEWLGRAVAEHDLQLSLLPIDPRFDVLRGDPRLDTVIERAGL